MNGFRLLVVTPLVALAALFPAAAATAQEPVRPFGSIDCTTQADGVRFCPGSVDTRVPSFDGVPLDVNVTLPPASAGEGPFPLIVQLHGYGGRKSGADASAPFARDGYAVLNYSARGFGESCGSPASRLADPAACAQGWVRLADTRYEVRDSQHLAGLLADQGIADPQRIGAMGGSYGGGQSLSLATLKDRVRLPDGSYAPWTSPGGLPMRIAAAVPSIPWSDLVYSLVPNGRTLDYAVAGPLTDLDPIGTLKTSFVAGLFASGNAAGYYAPPGADPDADLTTWFARVNAGDPYDGDPVAESIIDKIADLKSPYYLEMDREPAPLLISNGFTDDLFPVDEAVRYADKVKERFPGATVAQLHFDYGHMRGQNKPEDAALLTAQRRAFFARHLKGDAEADAPTGVTALTQTCPRSAPSGGPFTAPTWDALSPGEVRFSAEASQAIAPLSGDPLVARTFDPVAGGGACATTDGAAQMGVATYELPAVSTPYTLLGSPTILARLQTVGTEARIAMRLLDVAPDGTQTLVARGLYRPRTDGGLDVFQLHPGAWRFEVGHRPKLELLGQDAPYARQSNLPTPVTVESLELRLPVAEAPGTGEVAAPRAHVIPGPADTPTPAPSGGGGDGGDGGQAPPPGGSGSAGAADEPAKGSDPPRAQRTPSSAASSRRASVSVRIVGRRLRTALARRSVAVRTACTAPCAATLRLSIAGRRVAQRVVRFTRAGRRTVSLPLSARARTLLHQNPRRRLDVRVTVRDAGGRETGRMRATPRALG